jgi:hypothetical protein
MFRLVLGLIKGAILGAGVGYGAYYMGFDGGWNYVTYGLVGFIVGLFVGRPIWSHLLDKTSTVWTAIMKGLFGAGIGIGLYALTHKVLGDPKLTLLDYGTHAITDWQFLFGGAVGALFGAWIEVDDAPPAKDDKDAAKAKGAAK